jgi:hypothetical protein
MFTYIILLGFFPKLASLSKIGPVGTHEKQGVSRLIRGTQEDIYAGGL